MLVFFVLVVVETLGLLIHGPFRSPHKVKVDRIESVTRVCAIVCLELVLAIDVIDHCD